MLVSEESWSKPADSATVSSGVTASIDSALQTMTGDGKTYLF
jgi:hypothetical protein